MFELAEYSRATMIRDMQDEKVASYARIDQSIVNEEKSLKKELSDVTSTYFQYPDSLEIKNSLFEAKENLNKFISTTADKFPGYHSLKYGDQVLNVSEIQSQLQSEEMLIEYMIDDTSYYAISITQDNVDLYELGYRDSIDLNIKNYRSKLISGKKDNGKESSYLYTKLWKPIFSDQSKYRVIIVPVSTLLYLNMETLKNISTDKYLVENYNISYALSANIYFSEETNESKNKSLAIAIAPGFEDALKEKYKSKLDSNDVVDEEFLHTIRQPWSVKLAEKLKTEYRNKTYIAESAPESAVKSSLSQGNIIYFGTHAITDEQDPLRSKLVLSKELGENNEDGYLHAYEIYGLDLNADLTILSACESGIGQLEEGEGMISLAHSIHYAGCPSTVLSLWKVDERANTILTDFFLENIATGLNKSNSLRKAKLDYLKENPENNSPYYWGGMILMGKDGPVTLIKQNNFKWYFIIGGLLLLLFFGKKRLFP